MLALLCGVPQAVFAVPAPSNNCATQKVSYCNGYVMDNEPSGGGNCATYDILQFVDTDGVTRCYYTCTSCSGGTLTQKTLRPLCGTISYNYCAICSGCTDCSSTDWADSGTGYQSKTTATCNCNTCTKNTSYRCAAGYYGNPTTNVSGCTQCPRNSESTTSTTSPVGATLQTQCYSPRGAVFSDDSGSGTYNSDCNYTN